MASSSGTVSLPRCPVIFDGLNFTDFVSHMRIHMRGLGLWGILSGDVPCPPSPIAPVEPPLSATATDTDRATYDAAVTSYQAALDSYSDLLIVYTQWVDDDARASAVLVDSVLPQFSSEIVGFSTAFQMWTHLRQRYEPSGDTLFLSVVRQEHSLQQGDATVDEFYAQSSAIWRQLDSLRHPGCGSCQCCQDARADREFQRVYEFLSRLRPEFESRRAQLFARQPRVTLLEALTEVRAEETRLRGSGLLSLPSVLNVRPPTTTSTSAPTTSRPGASLPAASSGGGGRFSSGAGRPHCTYCDKDGHIESTCFRKKRHIARRSFSGTGASSTSATPTSLATSFHFNPRSADDIFPEFSGFPFPGFSSMGGMGGMSGGTGSKRGDPRFYGFRFGNDFFSPFGAESSASNMPRPSHKPAPIENRLPVTLADLYKGVTKKIKVSREIKDASGRVSKVEEILTIDVKPGWKKGTKITFPEKGNEFPNMTPADLSFIIEEKPHDVFTREGNDLVMTEKISLVEALTGYTVHIITLDGRSLSVPVSSVVHPSYEEVVPGEGMPIRKEPGKKGNLRVKFNIKFPSRRTSYQKDGIKRLLGS